MSEPKRDDEPTMEEILASIRKIISEDDPETAEAPPGGGAGITVEHEPMELTQMVSEDGSVVDLRSDQASGPVSLEEVSSDEAAIVEPLVPEDTRVHAELIGDDDGIQPQAEVLAVVADETAREMVAEPEPEIVTEPEPEVVTEPEPEIVAQPEPDPIPEVETAQAAAAESEAPLESLVSAKAAAAATAAMTRLNASLASESAAGASDKTLEALVRETMAPHLKAWLDENLPGLVERIVREEIERIVRRADPR